MNYNQISAILSLKKVTVTLFVIWTLITLFLTLVPGRYIPHYGIFSFDKLGHTALLFGWTYLLGLTMIDARKLAVSRIVLATFFGIFFGGLIEILQYVLPFHRDADIFDFMADLVGCLIALLLLFASKRALSK